MQLVLETKMYNLSTRSSACNILNQDKNYKSNCEYFIPNMIDRDESIEYIHFSIPTVVIPVSFYTISENNNQLDVIENGVQTSYYFPVGNYNANYFMAQFKTLLGAQWSITLNQVNSTFTVYNSLYPFTLLTSSTVDGLMGFNTDLSVSATPYRITLTRTCNFLPLPRVLMRCPQLANSTCIGYTTSSDVILSVPNDAKPNGQIYYINSNNSKMLLRHHEITRFVVSFTDDDGEFLNFNGISSFFTFQFDIYRQHQPKPPRFSEILRTYSDGRNYLEEEEAPVEENI